MRTLPVLALAALATAFAPVLGAGSAAAAARAAAAPLVVGIGDQGPATFSDPRFTALGVRKTRLVTPWNSVFTEPDRLDAWIAAARAAGLEPLIAFNAAADSRCPRSPCRLPRIGAYRHAVATFRRRYPWIRTFEAWNEANHQTQPTAHNPKRAAQYYNALRRLCRRCRVVAADVLDQSNMVPRLRVFKRYAKRPRLWGLHNYSDANRFRTTGTERLLATVRGEVWLTETGGVYRFRTADGRLALPPNSVRAARSLRFVFRLAATFPSRIKRLYIYQWHTPNPDDRFDAGLIAPDGRARRSYRVVRRLIRTGAPPLPLRGQERSLGPLRG